MIIDSAERHEARRISRREFRYRNRCKIQIHRDIADAIVRCSRAIKETVGKEDSYHRRGI